MPNFLSSLKSKLSPGSADAAAADLSSFRPPCFRTGVDTISDSFKHETGAHGWGNAELQNYINEPRCSFMRPSTLSTDTDKQLVICAHADNAAGRFESARLRSKFTLGDGPMGPQKGFLWARITAPVASTRFYDLPHRFPLNDAACHSRDVACILAPSNRAIQLAYRRRD
jgi:hypothetical protein